MGKVVKHNKWYWLY